MPVTSLIRAAALVSAVALVPGCAALSALTSATTELNVYELRPPAPGPVAAGGPLARALIIELPTTSGALETDRIMIRPNALQAQYLPEARWSDPSPVMVQTLMLRTIENSGGLTYVGREPLGPGGDYALVSELTDFQAEVRAGEATVIRLRLTARLVREDDIAIIATRTFETRAETATTGTEDVLGAFDRATQALMADIAGWVLGVLGVRLQASP